MSDGAHGCLLAFMRLVIILLSITDIAGEITILTAHLKGHTQATAILQGVHMLVVFRDVLESCMSQREQQPGLTGAFLSSHPYPTLC